MISPSLIVSFAAPRIAAPIRAEFEAMARLCHGVLEKLASDAGMPARIEAVLAEDFRGEVLSRMRERPGFKKEFNPERPLGRVSAKNLAQDDAWEHVTIVFNANEWEQEHTRSGEQRLLELSIIGHEFAHPVLARLRIASGADAGVIYPPVTPGEFARSISRILIDEYKADRVADAIVGALCTKTANGASSPAHVWDVRGAAYFNNLKEYLAAAIETLPAWVNAYRTHQLSLKDMWGRVVNATEHMLTMYIHARAQADVTGNIPLLDSPDIQDLPFVRNYLAPTVPTFVNELRDWPLLMPPDEWRRMEEKLVRLGEAAIMEIWRQLGLTFEETQTRGEYRINVASPAL